MLVAGQGCAPTAAPAPTRRAPAAFVIPTDLPNGRAELTIAPSYPIGTPLAIPITVVVTRGTITGPITARVLASGINEGGSPAEVLVRELAVAPVTVSSGRGSTTVSWDTKDRNGALVPADAYSLVLEFRSDDGGTSLTTKAGATLELR
jgi:hypothetical protein